MSASSLGLLPVVDASSPRSCSLDSYKLVKLRVVVAWSRAGMAAGGGRAISLNGARARRRCRSTSRTYTRYVAPVIEELLKALVIVALIRAHRIGFLVDAAIFGFAVGTGFALVREHLLPAQSPATPALGTWIVRGFGTAIMHGGATAIFAVHGARDARARRHARWRAFLPGFAIAVVLHSAYNHFFLSPFLSTLGIALALPLLLDVRVRAQRARRGRLARQGLRRRHRDAGAHQLRAARPIRPMGRYLHALKDKFQGPVVADLLCYLRLHTELALRAKGILMMRESGFDVPVDEATREKFAELRYLEKSIGRTGLLAMQPMLHMSHKDLWQLYMLGK